MQMAGQEEQAVTKKNRRAAPLRFFFPMELDFLHHLWFDYITPYISCQGRAFYQMFTPPLLFLCYTYLKKR